MRNGQTKVVKGNNFAINESIKKKKGNNTGNIFGALRPKVNKHIFVWSGYCIPNIKFISQMVRKISRPQESVMDRRTG